MGARQSHQESQQLTREQLLQKLQSILDRFQITIAEAHELAVLQDYEIVVIADDSGSMNSGAVPPEQREIGTERRTRWQELQETISLIVDLGSCFDASGLDIYFLNRPPLKGIRSSTEKAFLRAFEGPAKGSTPLTETLRQVVRECGGERPVLLFILTDGEPNGGIEPFRDEIRRLVKKKSTPHTFKVQIMACTADDEAVGYLDEIDREFEEVDCTDDYFSEMQQVLKYGRRLKRFTRGDWCMKAMLGPIIRRFDEMDERDPQVSAPRNVAVGGA